MNKGGHLNEKQLSGYFGNALEKTKKHEIGRHLLQCDFCLNRLPKPSPEQFWAALMTENDVNNQAGEKTETPLRLGFFTGFLTQPKILAWSAGGMVIALIFITLMWFGNAKSSYEDTEVAQVFDSEISELKQNEVIEEDIPPVVLTSKPNERTSSPESSSAVVFSKPSKPDLQKREQNLSTENNLSRPSKKTVQGEKSANISLTRGVSSKCSEGDAVEMQVGSDSDNAVIFKWTKIPNAVKYHLYISDDDEILLDEYETNQETEYVLRKTLDPSKTYKWKVVITLENGELKAGNSQKFTAKDVSQNQKRSYEKKKSGKRCSENK